MSRGVTATAWSAADILLRQGVQFGVMIVLARLITPAEFGTFAVLLLFTGVAAVVVDAGLSTALIQRRDLSHDDESTVFWANLALGLAMSIALAAAGGLLAGFYSKRVLEPLAWAMAANILGSSLQSVQTARLTKTLNFRPILISGLAGTLVSGATAITMASAGLGVWALVGQILTMTLVSGCVLWSLAGWRPRWVFNNDSARRLFGFGGYIFLANLSDVVYARLYTLLAARMFGFRDVGFYNRADAAQQFPVDMLGNISTRVMLPIFSAAADADELRRNTRRAVRTLMSISVPVLLGLAAVSQPFVDVVFGSQWRPVAPLLQILCLAGVLWPLHVINVQVLVAQGHARLALGLEIAKKSVGIAILIAGALLGGLTGLAWAQVVFALVAVVANTHYTRRFLDYGLVAQFKDCLPIVGISLPAVIAARLVVSYLDAPVGAVLLVAVVAAGAVYLGLVLVFRPVAVEDLMSAFRRRNKVAE